MLTFLSLTEKLVFMRIILKVYADTLCISFPLMDKVQTEEEDLGILQSVPKKMKVS